MVGCGGRRGCARGRRGEEDGGAWERVEFEEEAELFCYRKVEKDEGYGEEEAYQAFGEDVQGHDGGEGQGGKEGAL